jgi:hypothetical protein
MPAVPVTSFLGVVSVLAVGFRPAAQRETRTTANGSGLNRIFKTGGQRLGLRGPTPYGTLATGTAEAMVACRVPHP